MGGYQHTDPGRAPVTPDDVREAAVRYLTRTGRADLLDVLGLVEKPKRPDVCPACGQSQPVSGVCRRKRACRTGVDEGPPD